jgi:hypothetical protein
MKIILKLTLMSGMGITKGSPKNTKYGLKTIFGVSK